MPHRSKSIDNENKLVEQGISVLSVRKNLLQLALSIALGLGILYYVFFGFIDIKRFRRTAFLKEG